MPPDRSAAANLHRTAQGIVALVTDAGYVLAGWSICWLSYVTWCCPPLHDAVGELYYRWMGDNDEQ